MKIMRMLLQIILLFIVLSVFYGCQQPAAPGDQNADRNPTENKDTIFELNVYSDKQIYKTSDAIKIWTVLKYIGDKSEIKIWHGDPYINYSITDGKDFNLDGIRHDILTSTILKKGEQYRYDYIKSGGYSNDDPKASYWKKFFEEKELYLPEGEYIIKAYSDFSLTENVIDSHYNQYSELKIKVVK